MFDLTVCYLRQKRGWRVAALLLLGTATLGLGARVAKAQCLHLVSQNTLHFGQGTKTKMEEKVSAFKSMINNINPTGTLLVLMQEVMRPTDEYHPFRVPAGQYGYVVSRPRGASSYLERYGFLMARPATDLYLYDYRDMYPMPPKVNLVRPPVAVFLDCGGGKYVWILSFHAVFGRSESERLAEAKAMAQVIEDYLNCWVDSSVVSKCATPGMGVKADYLIIGGDWNLDDKQVKTEIEKGRNPGWTWKFDVLVSDKTSLRTVRNNGTWSASYDHFVSVWRGTGGFGPMINPDRVSFSKYGFATCKDSVGCKAYREKVSDHVGIRGVVQP